MKVQELIDYINSNGFYSIYEFEDSLTDKQFKELKIVPESINADRHRWYEISTTVYKVEDGYVGVRGVTYLYSEGMTYKDCDYLCEASEYEEVQTISYREKQKINKNEKNS